MFKETSDLKLCEKKIKLNNKHKYIQILTNIFNILKCKYII